RIADDVVAARVGPQNRNASLEKALCQEIKQGRRIEVAARPVNQQDRIRARNLSGREFALAEPLEGPIEKNAVARLHAHTIDKHEKRPDAMDAILLDIDSAPPTPRPLTLTATTYLCPRPQDGRRLRLSALRLDAPEHVLVCLHGRPGP